MKLKQLMPRQNVFNVNIRRRVPFSHDEVVADWGIQGAGLPHFSARLYEEVKLLNEAIGNYHAKTSLEVGCGYGRLTPWIVEQSDRHYAIDPEPALLNDAVKLYPSVHFHQASAQELPFPDNHFDLCVSWTVLQHIPSKELVRAVSEIRRVCMPEAVIILAEGVGKFVSGQGYWEHDLEVWKRLLFPWKLTWLKERKLEKSSKGVGHGLVMRFER
jgi:SAM-dependent methyltransferase